MNYVSKNSNRFGVGANKGSMNPTITVSFYSPLYPRNKDLWLDISVSPAVWRYYKESTTSWTL